MQDADDTSIPADVEEKLLRFARAGVSGSGVKGKATSVGGVDERTRVPLSIITSLSLAGHEVQAVDMTELRRRVSIKRHDERAELEIALAWAGKNFRYGEDQNASQYKRNEARTARC